MRLGPGLWGVLCLLGLWSPSVTCLAAPDLPSMPTLSAGEIRGPASASVPHISREMVTFDEERFTLWRREPATADDVGLLILPLGSPTSSFAYRVRDRKGRDRIFYAMYDVSTLTPRTQVLAALQQAFGPERLQEREAATGVVTLTAGTAADYRLAEVIPAGAATQVRVRRVCRYRIPPRRYTLPEQRVMRVLEAVARTYATADRVAYTVNQSLITEEEEEVAASRMRWQLDFSRPATLLVIATHAGREGLRLQATVDEMRVDQPGRPTQRRPVAGPLTLAELPELEEDPVACLMLGESPLSPAIDYLALHPLPGIPAHQQQEIVLTYPDRDMSVRLQVDLARAIILRCDTIITAEGERTCIRRHYSDLRVTPAAVPPAALLSVPEARAGTLP
jgi:hypothetical protein